ncbi:unnamed protein product [Merluccius merluccius]
MASFTHSPDSGRRGSIGGCGPVRSQTPNPNAVQFTTALQTDVSRKDPVMGWGGGGGGWGRYARKEKEEEEEGGGRSRDHHHIKAGESAGRREEWSSDRVLFLGGV